MTNKSTIRIFARAKIAISIALVASLTICAPMFAGNVEQASAITMEEAAAQVEATFAAYNEAKARQDELQTEISSLEAQIADLEFQIPGLQEKAGEICRAMYVSGDANLDLISAILSAESLGQAIRIADTYEKVLRSQTDQLQALVDAKHELEDSKAKLDTDKAQSDATVTAAKEALDAAISARQQAQAEARAAGAGALAQQIDWSLPRDEFVASWGARINKYLSGTKLSGQGESFADAAYEYGADPRLSPAISRIESGCGAACFRPYNAWGWMGKSFSNWGDAIYAHVKYLSGPLYGGYLTMKVAQMYCPPTAGEWYSKVSAEMGRM